MPDAATRFLLLSVAAGCCLGQLILMWSGDETVHLAWFAYGEDADIGMSADLQLFSSGCQ